MANDSASGTSSDAEVQKDVARESWGGLSFDMSGDPGDAPYPMLPDVTATMPAVLDALERVEPAQDGPVADMFDAPDSAAGKDESFYGPSSIEDGGPDSLSILADAGPDAPIVVPADAAPDARPPSVGPDAADVGGDGAGDSAQDFVSWETFLAQTPREPWTGGRFIVDGDLAFDEAGLQRYYQAYFAAAGVPQENLAPMGATVLWPPSDSMSLSYCISTDFGGNLAAVETAMQTATASWSDRAGVAYTYLQDEDSNCITGNSNVAFDIRPVSGAGYAAVSFFPDSPRANRSVFVDTSVFASSPGVDIAGVLRHQLGHTLGLQHEHLWLDPACTSEDSRLAVRIAADDSDTVMHLPACRPSEHGGTTQTEGDLVGAVTVYGLSPALIVTSEI